MTTYEVVTRVRSNFAVTIHTTQLLRGLYEMTTRSLRNDYAWLRTALRTASCSVNVIVIMKNIVYLK